jgi:uncharacterized membrane protein YdjX (TVP38/TMEM64 family)
MKHAYTFKIAILSLLGIVGIYLFAHYHLYVFFIDRQKAINLVKSFGPYSVFIFIVLQILQVIVAPIPGEITGFLGGYLYGSVLGTIYSSVGLTLGSWVAFMLARWYGYPFVERIVTASILEKYNRFMKHQGVFISFMLFLIPGFPKDCLCYIMGLSRMNTIAFIIIATIGRLFGTVLLSLSGGYARNNNYEALVAVLGLSCVLLLMAWFFRKKWTERL